MGERKGRRRGPESLNPRYPSGSVGVFMQVTLAITYMYLILIGYRMMGLPGVVFVSLTFLLAVFFPGIYRLLKRAWIKRNHRGNERPQPLGPGYNARADISSLPVQGDAKTRADRGITETGIRDLDPDKSTIRQRPTC
jgi:hypothetical protein